jgi:alpha-amylase/alpha-mannosidase (GH57 family)
MKHLSLAFLWHLHQPSYRLRGERTCFHPWVRLHAIRSYYDMIRVLEEFPEMRVTMNLVPSLVEQILAYESGESDLFLEIGAVPAGELEEAQRIFLFDHFFSAQETRMIGALPRFADLLQRRARARRIRGAAEAWKELSTADYGDLQALFDLCWFGFKAREDFPEIGALVRRGMGFRPEEIRRIHGIEREIIRRILPLYRKAAAEGRIEISASPHSHPILPLILDSESAREALPQAVLPPRFRRPGDARAQVVDALSLMEKALGERPRGMWPSEGSLSQETAELLAGCGLAWAAGDGEILSRSDRAAATMSDGRLPDAPAPPDIGRAWEAGSSRGTLALLFRDHDLSDRISFAYSGMEADRAAADFVGAVEERAQRAEGKPALLLVALDGENPWEHFPHAGADFLRALYGALLRSRAAACRTVRESLAVVPERGAIRRLHAGSWIRSDFGTWIGGPEKNHAWTILGRVRSDLEVALQDPGTAAAKRHAAWASLRAAEGSDWFWWLDGQFSSAHRLQFDQVFRGHLRQAYEALGRAAPDLLSWPIPGSAAAESEAGGVEPLAPLSPTLDGFEGDFFEWVGAEAIPWSRLSPSSTQERAKGPLDSLRFAFSRKGDFLLRIDPPDASPPGHFASLRIEVTFRGSGEATAGIALELDEKGDLRAARRMETPADGSAGRSSGTSGAAAAARKIFEMSVPSAETGLNPGESALLRIRIERGGTSITLREIGLRVPSFSGRARR